MSEMAPGARLITAAIEKHTGYDSIATIESHYVDDDGHFLCPFPGCGWKHHDSLQMWLHAHGMQGRGNKHPCSWLPRHDRG